MTLSRLRSLWRNLVHPDRGRRPTSGPNCAATLDAIEEQHRRAGMTPARGGRSRDAPVLAGGVAQGRDSRHQGRRLPPPPLRPSRVGPGRALCREAAVAAGPCSPSLPSRPRRSASAPTGPAISKNLGFSAPLSPVRAGIALRRLDAGSRPERLVGPLWGARREFKASVSPALRGQSDRPAPRSGAAAREVVGVARDTRYANVKDAPREVVYARSSRSASKHLLRPNRRDPVRRRRAGWAGDSDGRRPR